MKPFLPLSALLVAVTLVVATTSLATPPPVLKPNKTETAATPAVPPPPPIVVPNKNVEATTTSTSVPAPAAPAKEPDPIRIGMVQTLFIDVPPVLVNMLSPQFRNLMKEFTGLNGQAFAGGDAFQLAKELMEDKTHVAVLHGVEFAWVSQKYPDIKPLMIAVSKHHALKAFVVVSAESEFNAFADLKGKELGIHFRPREHLRLFVDKSCKSAGQPNPKAFFSKVLKPLHSEAALDDVLSGKTDAAVIDTLAMESYAHAHPGRHSRLKVIAESEPFPTAVVVYRQGFLSEATLEKFRKGMVSANQSEKGRDLMSTWKLTAFEAIPAQYVQDCVNLAKAYPPPVPATTVSRPKE